MTGTVVGFAWNGGALERRTVVRCALSRICGVCGLSLGRPIAFVGDGDEHARGTFHLPPLHVACAEDLVTARPELGSIVLTAGYEFVRAGKDDLDPEPRFVPNAVL